MSFLVTAEIRTIDRFDELRRAIEVSLNKALVNWAVLALEEVRAGAPVGHRPDFEKRAVSPGVRLRDSFQVAHGHKFGGMSMVVYSTDPNAVWQELGTRGRRRRHLKSGGRNVTEANRGVTGKHFMHDGMVRAYGPGLAMVKAALAGGGTMAPLTMTRWKGPHVGVGTTSPRIFGRG